MSLPHSTHHDKSLGRAIIEAVAAEKAVEPTALPPLYESVDPETLDSLFEETDSGTVRKIAIEFVYDGSLVRVTVDDGLFISINEVGEQLNA